MQRSITATFWNRRLGHSPAPRFRIGLAMVVTVVAGCVCALPAVAAEPVGTEDHRTADNSADDGTESADSGNGGTATATSGGEVVLGEIVTGENNGNTIITGNISGSAEFSGGDIDYATDVDLTLENASLVADASGGDSNEAAATNKDDANANNDGDTDVKVINRNNNRSSATITTAPAP